MRTDAIPVISPAPTPAHYGLSLTVGQKLEAIGYPASNVFRTSSYFTGNGQYFVDSTITGGQAGPPHPGVTCSSLFINFDSAMTGGSSGGPIFDPDPDGQYKISAKTRSRLGAAMRRPFASLAALQLSFDLPGGLLHRAAACLLLLLATLVTLKAQDRGSVSGTITDPSNAGVPDVIVTITDQRTNVVRTASTNGSGAYTVGDLIPDPLSRHGRSKRIQESESVRLHPRGCTSGTGRFAASDR